MRNVFLYDGKSSLDYGVWINGSGILVGAAPDVSTVKVPGRNGELIYSNHSFNNVPISYDAFMIRNFVQGFQELRAFLYSDFSYRRLEDSYYPDYFRMARISGSLKAEDIIWHNDQGMFTINFDCKPQLFLKSGETAVEVTNGGTIKNPTYYDSKPLIRVYGNGTLTINGEQITIASDAPQYVDLDCEIMEAYYGNQSMNSKVTLSEDDYPVLHSGDNGITYSGDITRVQIIPRWFTI